MKKTVIAASVVAVLVIGYTAASWYTGNKIEENFGQSITHLTDKINQKMDNTDNDMFRNLNISYSNYQKGIFSSTVHLKASFTLFENTTETFFDNDVTLYHGPFPWNLIASGSFLPKFAAVFYETQESDNTLLWKAADNKPFLTANGIISYNNNVDIVIKTPTLDIKNDIDQYQLNMAPTSTLISIENFKKVDFDMNVPQIIFTDLVRESNVEANTIQYHSLSSFDEEQTGNEKGQLSIANLIINNDPNGSDNNAINIQQLILDTNINEKANQSVGQLAMTIAKVEFGQQNLGNSELQISYDINSALFDNDMNINSIFNIDKFIWHTSQGDIDGRLALNVNQDLADIDQANEDDVELIDAKLNIPLKTLNYVIAQINNPNKSEPDSSDIQAVELMTQLYLGIIFANSPLIEVKLDENEENIESLLLDMYYSKNDNQARLKGQPLTPGQFWHNLLTGVNQISPY